MEFESIIPKNIIKKHIKTNKMTRQEIIEILKDAKENGKRIRMSYMAYNHTTCAYILHNSGIHKNQKGGESYITWNYNYELVNVVRKEVDHFGNCKTENYAIRLNNIKELQVINN